MSLTTEAGGAIVPAVSTWPLLRELTPAVSQGVFRTCMDAFARPGSVQWLAPESVPAPVPAVMAPLLALADLMTPICAMPSGDERTIDTGADVLPDAVTDAVGVAARLIAAPVVGPSHARFAVAFNEPDEMARLNTGSQWSPETGAMLLQRVTALAPAEAGPGWKLTGPGVREGDAALITVVGLRSRFVTERARLTSDYPAGIDCLLVADQGAVVGLPRTTRIEVI